MSANNKPTRVYVYFCSSLSISESLWKIDYIYTGFSSIDIVKQSTRIKKGLILLFLNSKSHEKSLTLLQNYLSFVRYFLSILSARNVLVELNFQGVKVS